MTRLLTIIIFILTFSSCNEEIKKTGSPPAIKSTETEKNTFKEFHFKVEGEKVKAKALLADGQERKETIIWVPKYAGYSTKVNITKELQQSGRNVILLDHRGFKESEGFYSYSNCLVDIEELVKYLTNKTNAEKLKIDPERLVLIGLSYGAGIALIKGSELKSIQNIIGINTLNYGENMEAYNSVNELAPLIKFMKKQSHINHNAEEFVTELFENKKKFNILSYQKELARKNIMLIEWTNTNGQLIEKLVNAKSINIKSDKDYIKKRTELVNVIIDWLNKN